MPAGRFWSTTEQETAVRMRARGLSYGQIAFRMDRTPNAVAARLRYLRTASKPPRTVEPKPPPVRPTLSPFERQLVALIRGARLAPKFVPPPRSYDFTLGGVSEI